MQQKNPSTKVKNVFWVVSTHFQVNLKVTQNLKKSHEVGLTPPGQPVFWANQLLGQFEKDSKNFMFFLPIFFHRNLG